MVTIIGIFSVLIGHFFRIGSMFHAETINDACWVEGYESTYLLTGSNDCTVKLSKLEKNQFVSSIELPPHESCVRGVCSSRHPNSKQSLLVSCGGKLSLEFYLLDDQASSCSVSLLCSYRTIGSNKTAIDHRMNAVRATFLFPHKNQCHMVVAGDSDGNLHLCVISERTMARKTTIGTILQGNGRPVLCLELLRCFGKILCFVGTTDGEISVWELPGGILVDNSGEISLEGAIPESPLYTYNAHQSGVNDLSVAIIQSRNSTDLSGVIVCSVGDDQALSTCVLHFTDTPHELKPKKESFVTTYSASASAFKAVSLITDCSFYRVYTTGHDEKITLWHIDATSDQISVKFIASSALGTASHCIDCVQIEELNGTVTELIAVGGDGVELQSINLNILQAAQKLQEANYLVSVDS